MTEIISGIYRIINTVTGDFYIGSSKNVKSRWKDHKCKSKWKKCPNNPMYQDMQKYGIDKFEMQILEVVEPEELKGAEQQFIETLKPTYNSNRAKGLNIERYKEYQIEYYQQNREKRIEYQKEYQKEYHKSERYKEYQKEYHKSERYKEYQKEHYQKNREKCKECQNKYNNQLCYYNGETLTLAALSMRFSRAGIAHPTAEAKKYLVL